MVLEQVQRVNPEDVEQQIGQAADSLYGMTLLKRVKIEISGLKDGFLPSELLGELASRWDSPDLSIRVEGAIKHRINTILSRLDVDSLIKAEREALDAEWNDPERRLSLAPGAEILKQVFRHLGGQFDKRKDSPRIASQMAANEIDREIAELIERLTALSNVAQH